MVQRATVELGRRSRATLRDRLNRVRVNGWLLPINPLTPSPSVPEGDRARGRAAMLVRSASLANGWCPVRRSRFCAYSRKVCSKPRRGWPGRDSVRADAALARLRAAEADLVRFQDALAAGQETSTVAPVRWRSRGALAQYVDSAEYVARALRNVRVLVRRAVVQIKDGEPVPAGLVQAVRMLGEAVAWLRRELADAVEPEAARDRALSAVRAAAGGYTEGVGFSGSVVVAQVRSAATDLVRATGVAPADADRLVRRSFGRAVPG